MCGRLWTNWVEERGAGCGFIVNADTTVYVNRPGINMPHLYFGIPLRVQVLYTDQLAPIDTSCTSF
jgi:hypothetical protein